MININLSEGNVLTVCVIERELKTGQKNQLRIEE